MFLYKSAVIKHGSHDQSSHNPKKGGGRSGGGQAGSSSGSTTAIAEAKQGVDNMIRGAESQRGRVPKGVSPKAHEARISGTLDGFKTSKEVIGKPQQLKFFRESAEKSWSRSRQDNSDAGLISQNYWNGFKNAVITVEAQYGDLEG